MEDQFDKMVRERLEKAALDPPAGAWDRIRKRNIPQSPARLVWVRLAAGLLVAGLAAAYFIQDEQTPEQVAAVMLSAPALEPVVAETPKVEEDHTDKVVKLEAVKVPSSGDVEPEMASTVSEQLSDESVQELVIVKEESPVVAQSDQDSESMDEGVVLVYELPVDIASDQLLNDRPVRSGLARFGRLVREVKNGEVSLGHVRELKNSMFTRNFWKEKISKNTNQIMQ